MGTPNNFFLDLFEPSEAEDSSPSSQLSPEAQKAIESTRYEFLTMGEADEDNINPSELGLFEFSSEAKDTEKEIPEELRFF